MPNPRIEEAMRHAHLPSLVAALVHLTGDRHWLSDEFRAEYPLYATVDQAMAGGYPPALQEEIRERAVEAIGKYLDDPQPLDDLDVETVSRLINHVAGADVPDSYRAFLLDELGIGGVDTKTPHWESPVREQAAGDMHVVIVGAGMSGLLMALRLKQAGVPFTVIEKNADVGGTWLENTYPGCRVDNPNHMYSYSFEPTHAFPQHYSTQPVLLEYFRDFAARHDLRAFIRFETRVNDAAWDAAQARWSVNVTRPDGMLETIDATALITAVGQLNQPHIPDIPGRESFAGPTFHSATWDHEVDLTGKRVAVIGTGASAYQFVPRIAPDAAHLTVFQRTPPWAVPRENYHHDVAAGKQWLLEHVPFYARWYRFFLFWTGTDGLYDSVKADEGWQGPPHTIGAANAEVAGLLTAAMQMQTEGRDDLAAAIVPTYPLGGKRPLLDNGQWVETLKRDDVALVTAAIVSIDTDGVTTADGVHHDADMLIYGTGFTASKFLTPMEITGADGRTLNEVWGGDGRAYLGMTVPGFPNLFMIYGPNTNIVVNGSIVFFSECSVRYILGCLKLIAETGSASLDVRRDVFDAYNVRIDAGNAKMAWGSPNVTSWYKSDSGRVSQNWPFPIVDYWTATVKPDSGDFILRPADLDAAA